MTEDFNALAAAAQNGDKDALDALVRSIQRPVYNLAVRMLRTPTDAEDAAQEILIKVVTHLSSFRGESRFETWMYRVASNHLLTHRRRADALQQLSFEQLSARLHDAVTSLTGLAIPPPENVVYFALVIPELSSTEFLHRLLIYFLTNAACACYTSDI